MAPFSFNNQVSGARMERKSFYKEPPSPEKNKNKNKTRNEYARRLLVWRTPLVALLMRQREAVHPSLSDSTQTNAAKPNIANYYIPPPELTLLSARFPFGKQNKVKKNNNNNE